MENMNFIEFKLIHHFHIRENGLFKYEFIFSNNTKLKILFRKLSINIEKK